MPNDNEIRSGGPSVPKCEIDVLLQERQWKNFLESYCSENVSVLPMYWHVIIAAIVWFPLGVMVICYSAIFWKLDRYEQKVLRRENPISICYKTKVAKMLFAVLIVFILFRLPFTCLIFIRNQMLKNSQINQIQGAFDILWYTAHYLMFCNAAINPIIYGLTNDNFRKAYRQTPLARLFCLTAESPPKPKSGAAVQGAQVRTNNMVIGQSANGSHNLNPSCGTNKTQVKDTTNVFVISTNLIDSNADPQDYNIIESSESQAEPLDRVVPGI